MFVRIQYMQINKINSINTVKNKLKNLSSNKKICDITDKIIYEENHIKKETKGNVTHLTSSSLNRGKFNVFENKKTRNIVFISLIIASLFVIILLLSTFGFRYQDKEKIKFNLGQDIDYKIPKLEAFLNLTKQQTEIKFNELSLNYIQLSEIEENSSYYNLFKIPDGCTTDQALLAFNKGIENITDTDASLMFNGGWAFSADYNKNSWVRIKYTDFKSTNEIEAIDKAILNEDFKEVYTDAEDVDDMGNTYKTGTAKYNGSTIGWRVSALPLSSVYNFKFEKEAIYVGIRIEIR